MTHPHRGVVGERLDGGCRGLLRRAGPSGQVRADGDDDRHGLTTPGHRDRDVAERHPDGRLRLVHGDGDLVDGRVGEGVLGDERGEPLDEVVRLALDAGEGRGTDVAVVDGVREVVGGPRPR